MKPSCFVGWQENDLAVLPNDQWLAGMLMATHGFAGGLTHRLLDGDSFGIKAGSQFAGDHVVMIDCHICST